MTLPSFRLRKSSPWKLRVHERRTVLMAGDATMGLISLATALYVWGSRLRFIDFDLTFFRDRVPFWFYLLPAIWLILLVELYDPHKAVRWRETVRGITTSALIGFGVYVAYYFFSTSPGNLLPRLSVAIFLGMVSILTLIWRWAYIRIFTAPEFMRRVLLVGAGNAGVALLKIVNDLWPPPFYVAGIVDDDPDKAGQEFEGYQVLGSGDDLLKIIDHNNISDIIVAISGEMKGSMFQALLDAQELGVDIIRMPRIYEDLLGRVPIRFLEADWVLRSFVDETRVNAFFELVKRLIDILGGLIGGVVFILILPLLSLAIFLDDGRPIFYSQTRSGRGGQPYTIIKYRTMMLNAEADGKPQWAKEDDVRATKIGRILRKTHLDELPQFYNVLRGEMSLVGPRAERPELVDIFQSHIPFYRTRLLVKPGITGWAQVNFGYASTVDETIIKLEYDLYYIKNRNLFVDFFILMRTPATMLGFRGR
ncbi:MAG TPA: sugar transferase [Anaerolineales bacterium]|nr:sugar transferase [Anaerolineales bacterium]